MPFLCLIFNNCFNSFTSFVNLSIIIPLFLLSKLTLLIVNPLIPATFVFISSFVNNECALSANFNVEIVSSYDDSKGLTVAIRIVRVLPPNEF